MPSLNCFTEEQFNHYLARLREWGFSDIQSFGIIKKADDFWSSADTVSQIEKYFEYRGLENNVEELDGNIILDFALNEHTYSIIFTGKFQDFISTLEVLKDQAETLEDEDILTSIKNGAEEWVLSAYKQISPDFSRGM